jgi:hypothetical protein
LPEKGEASFLQERPMHVIEEIIRRKIIGEGAVF